MNSPEYQIMISDIKESAENISRKVWFVDVVTEYGVGHHVPIHVTIERCAEILNANYLAVVDQDCPPSIGTEKWLRVLHKWSNLDIRCFAEFAKQKRFYRAISEVKNQLKLFFWSLIQIRSIIKNLGNQANSIVIYLDSANSLQMTAVWLSVASFLYKRNKITVWIHFHKAGGWLDTKVGRFARNIFKIVPIKVWKTAFTQEIAAEKKKKYGWDVDVLPAPLNPFLGADGWGGHKSNKNKKLLLDKPVRLICWLLVTRPEQGLDRLQMIISHRSANDLPEKYIKCFVSERANIRGNDQIELVRLPYGAKDYFSRFNECSVVLLPYNAHLFGEGASMIFNEAVATFKIPIVLDGTVMATELRKFNLDDLILDFDNEFSWTAINKIRESISIRERLNLMADCYARKLDTFTYAESIYKKLKQQSPKIALTEPKRA